MIVPVDETNLLQAATIHSISWKESHRAFCTPDFIETHTPDRQREYLRNKINNGTKLYMLTACAVPPKTEANVTDPDAMNATAVRQTEADTKTDWAQGLTEQQEVETEIEKAVGADTLDRLQQDAAELLEEYETAKLDGTEEEAAKLNEAYERVLAEINAMLG